ncbi:MAG: hypothetical protein KBE04_05360 [Phycisphaerae bacterium]|nr:hypothetical protein [Phycisphaerae bacterium]
MVYQRVLPWVILAFAASSAWAVLDGQQACSVGQTSWTVVGSHPGPAAKGPPRGDGIRPGSGHLFDLRVYAYIFMSQVACAPFPPMQAYSCSRVVDGGVAWIRAANGMGAVCGQTAGFYIPPLCR